MLNVKLPLALSAMGLLVACGGTSSGSVSVSDINAELAEISTVLDSEFDGLDVAAVQTIGSATYEGLLIAGAFDGDDTFFGESTLNVNFVTEEVSGGATDFVVVDGADISDDVDLFEGIPTGTPTQDVAGSLTYLGGALTEEADGAVIDFEIDGALTIPASILETASAESVSMTGAGAVVFSDDVAFGLGTVVGTTSAGSVDIIGVIYGTR